MQRMKLHLSGVKVPKLGSLQDKLYRQYMTKDSQLEVEKMKLVMLSTLTNPTFNDPNAARDWHGKIKKNWADYLSLQFGIDIPEHTEKEMVMLEYYENVVKHLKPQLVKDKKGLGVKGLENLFR